MKFSFIATADWHMSNNLPYSKPGIRGKTDRLEDQMAVWNQVHTIAVDNDVDNIFVLGDLFDRSKVDPITLTHTVEAIMRTTCTMSILPGNHDANSVNGGRFAVEAFREMKNELVQVIGETPGQSYTVEMESRNITIWPLAFAPVAVTEAALKKIKSTMDKKDFNILMVHNSIMGAHHLGWKCDDGLDPRKTCAGFDMVLAGHFHENQQLETGKPSSFGRYQYLGAPMHLGFGDVGRETCVWLYEFEDVKGGLKVKTTKKTLMSPRFHKIRYGEPLPADIRRGDYLMISAKATHSEWALIRSEVQAVVDDLKGKDGIHAMFHHQPVYHHTSRTATVWTEIDAEFSLEKAIGEYVESDGVNTDGMDKDELKKIGLEALKEIG